MALIQWIEQPELGSLGVMARPGRQRSLERDLADLKKEGVDTLVCLLTPEEIQQHGLQEEPEIAKRLGIEFKRFPIKDRSTPPANAETLHFLEARLNEVEKGRSVVFHCSSGRGRTGAMAASLLVLQGFDPDKAMKHVRGHRLTTVPDTEEQMEWVRALADARGVPREPRQSDGRVIAVAACLLLACAGLYFYRKSPPR